MSNAKIFQIFYDAETRAALDPAFIPLDNSGNERPDWFEFWVIRNYLKTERLDENCFYGFLSPSFRKKTRIEGKDLLQFLGRAPLGVDVVLFSHGWDQIAYFRNVFEQGEYFHKGLMQASQEFFTRLGISIELSSVIGHSMNSVFSNYFAAKPKFWMAWLKAAERLWEICETELGPLVDTLNSVGSYQRVGRPQVSMKVFVQERIASGLLATGLYQTICLDMSNFLPVFDRLFSEDMRTRRLLSVCDTMKLEAVFRNDKTFVEVYEKCKAAIDFRC